MKLEDGTPFPLESKRWWWWRWSKASGRKMEALSWISRKGGGGALRNVKSERQNHRLTRIEKKISLLSNFCQIFINTEMTLWWDCNKWNTVGQITFSPPLLPSFCLSLVPTWSLLNGLLWYFCISYSTVRSPPICLSLFVMLQLST